MSQQSDTAPSPLSAGMVVEAVDEALARAGEYGPWSEYPRSSKHGKHC